MSLEGTRWNTPSEQEQAAWKQAPDHEETDRQQEARNAELRERTETYLARIEDVRLREEATEELTEKGLYNSEVSAPSEIRDQELLLNIVWERKVWMNLKKLASELEDGEEKDFVAELEREFLSGSLLMEREYRHRAKKNDLGSERYHGEPTAQYEIRALENLQIANVLNQDEFEGKRLRILQQMEENTRL